jgi:hypothetical protein
VTTRPDAEDGTKPHPAVAVIDSIVEARKMLVQAVQPGMGEYHLRHLVAVYEWALAQQPYAAGDRVELAVDLDIKRDSGWWPHRDTLVRGAVATVEDVSFNSHYGARGAHLRFDAYKHGIFHIWLDQIAPQPDGGVR